MITSLHHLTYLACRGLKLALCMTMLCLAFCQTPARFFSCIDHPFCFT